MPAMAIRKRSNTSNIDTDRKRRRLTRSQEQQIRGVFPFLALPAELRMVVYDYAIDTAGARKLLQCYYDKIRDATTTEISKIMGPLVYFRTPTILLLNKQIHREAYELVPKRQLTFDHGLLDLADLQDFVSPALLHTVSSITINDSGHPLFKSNMIAASWMGYMTLLEQLADVLSRGHKLKTFEISFEHEELVPHITICWAKTYNCGFRDTLRKACDALRSVRNVGSVTLRGLPEPLASQLKARMESTPINFLDLPAELRNKVYGYAADWSDITPQLAETMSKWLNKTMMPLWPARSTPTILLLNKQITNEALVVLRNKPLVLSLPVNHDLQYQAQVPVVLNLVSPTTLKYVQHLVLDIGSWEWVYSLDSLLPHFGTYTGSSGSVSPITAQHISFTAINVPTTHHNTPTTGLPILGLTPAVHSLDVRFSDILKDRFLDDPQ
ncbi:hypothetical protein LTR78_000410 [Recurvomyces mirabilis]|uniref:Uncharacterized protein n=1 Tax=Recurvomyces mirabilis TaxID=574656 RepID=A0AAE0WXY2_9PEZI|nr:hypothetical protein LTR78_000410 [Recurvomyces mirabilis]KAK5162065.1 hypothetical protein LTS14_000411 [Recurvomyces mirabilis]